MKKRKGYRLITIGEEVWQYKIGTVNIVAFSMATGEKRLSDLSKVSGLPWDQVDRGKWKEWFSITPKDIAEWLKEGE